MNGGLLPFVVNVGHICSRIWRPRFLQPPLTSAYHRTVPAEAQDVISHQEFLVGSEGIREYA